MLKLLAAYFDFVPLSGFNAFKTRYLLKKKINTNIKNTYIYILNAKMDKIIINTVNLLFCLGINMHSVKHSIKNIKNYCS